jgi:hypothetical protein
MRRGWRPSPRASAKSSQSFGQRCIEDGSIVATGLLADGAGEPALADAGWADKGQIVVGVDPFALRELQEQGAVEPPGGAIVDILDARQLTKPGRAQPRG